MYFDNHKGPQMIVELMQKKKKRYVAEEEYLRMVLILVGIKDFLTVSLTRRFRATPHNQKYCGRNKIIIKRELDIRQ